MNDRSAIYIIALLLTTGIAAGVDVLAWRRRTAVGALPLMMLMIALGVWLLSYALEIASPGLSTKVFWNQVRYFGYVTAPLASLALALQYTGYERWLAWRNLLLAAIVPLVVVLLVWTNPLHGLIWA